MSNIFYCLAIFLFSHFVACSNMSTEPQSTDDTKRPMLLPTTVGNFWTYETARFAGEPDTVTIRNAMLIAVDVNGQIIQGVVQEHFWEDYDIVWPRKWIYGNGSDGLYQLGGMTETDTLIEATLKVKYPVQVGESWQVPHLVYEYNSQRFTYTDSLTYQCVSVDCTYTTAVASFDSCLVVKYYKPFEEEDVHGGQNFYLYYKPDLGLVAIETKNTDLVQETRELYSYLRLINFWVQNNQN